MSTVTFQGPDCGKLEIVLNGKLYKHDTSTVIAKGGDIWSCGHTRLLQTKGGAYWRIYKRNGPSHHTDIWEAEPLTVDEAKALAFLLDHKAATEHFKITIEEA